MIEAATTVQIEYQCEKASGDIKIVYINPARETQTQVLNQESGSFTIEAPLGRSRMKIVGLEANGSFTINIQKAGWPDFIG